MTSPDSRPAVSRLDFLPWEYAGGASAAERERQAERQRELTGETDLAADAFIADTAAVFCNVLRMGERSYIGAHAYVTGEVSIGADSTINPFTVVRGKVTLGDGVRIGAHASLLAFNHGTAPDQPIFRQAHTSRGITVGDDVWIGSNALILDGVTIGPHSIVGAGAVVTKNVAPWSVVAGNPAKPLRDRRHPSTPKPPVSEPANPAPSLTSAAAVPAHPAPSLTSAVDLPRLAAELAGRAREQVDELVGRCWDGERFVDQPGGEAAIRPWCDAIELTDLLVRRAPAGHSVDDLVRRLRARQDPATGLVPSSDLADAGLEKPSSESELSVLEGGASYHVLCAGYALQLLGSCFEHPIRVDVATDQLDNLPWARNAWGAGAAIDALGTAIARNLNNHGDSAQLFTLMGWLTARADPETGMWGTPHPDDGWLQVVNGFYRLTRGTYAQYGLPLPYPEAAIRTVLTHSQDQRVFSGDGFNACNVLDVIHPLWLAGKQTEFRRAEGRRWAERMLTAILGRWVDGAGFAFAPDGDGDRALPGLQGTEMWLAIIWLLTDYLGLSDVLGYRPRGVHRPEPLIAVPKLG
ncbi:acyltransferase [Kribbella sp. CA-294648]|uniref:acyltransferase n=1 Tax=Kribbella sp. CA-294648 TaxID=3239948 RepID=UPI003D8ECCFF